MALGTRLPGAPPGTVIPLVGATLAPQVETCVGGVGRVLPTTPSTCAAWTASGPVNIVVLSPPAVDPVAALTVGGWRPAAGHWIVARGAVISAAAGCAPAWHASGPQVELRLTRAERRHWKPVTEVCSTPLGRLRLTFGNAHTDLFDTQRCGGDRAVDWDAARDAAVAALVRSHRVVAYVEVDSFPPQTTFPGGCGRRIPSDGRVAYVVLA